MKKSKKKHYNQEFRVWCPDEERFETDSSYWLYQSGKLDHDSEYITNQIVQRYTGITDKNKKKVFEGDIVEFEYFAGDLAVSDMTEEEYEKYEKIAGKIFVGDVRQSLFVPCNLEIVSEINSCPAYFPLTYLHGATIIGNIFQPPFKNEK